MTHPRPLRLNTTLSPELQRDAVRRLGAIALTLAGVTATLRTSDILTGPPTALATPIRWALAVVAVTICIALYIAIRRRYLTDRQALVCGVAFQVTEGLLAAIGFHATGLAEGIEIRGWTPIAVWMLLYPLMIPAPTRRVVIATLLTAATDPIGLLVNVAAGAPMPNASVLSHMFLPTALACVVAPITARIVYSLTVEVKRAREMGSYRLVRKLGHGGMGEVWRAEHCMLARPAALKLIRPHLLGADEPSRKAAVARFGQEARATAALRSAHTVSVYDFGVTEEGAFYYVMELLDGMSFETLVQRFGPLTPARAVYLIRQVCHSLGEAHAAGMIHRDVKPANLFTCRLGPDTDFVKVLDFGLVKHTSAADSQAVTLQGVAMGTPSYIAPEVATGSDRVDSRADIYGLGCVAYWLLTGTEVFTSNTPVGVILAHVQSTPEAPSRRTELPIPPALDELILSCLAKNPDDRPANADQLARLFADAVPGDGWGSDDAREWWLTNHPSTESEPEVTSDTSVVAPVRADTFATQTAPALLTISSR